MICITFTKINTRKKEITWIKKTEKILTTKKLRLTDNYQYLSEEQQQQISKKFNKKESPKKPTKIDWRNRNKWGTI